MEILGNQTLLTALAIGAASGSIGAFIILRRMALVGDALSHVALPGIALALFYKLDPLWGVLVFLVGAAFLIWWLEGKSALPTDAIVGLLFTASLAVGVLTIPNAEIIETLFGAFPAMSGQVFGMIIAGAAALVLLTLILAKKFIFIGVSPDVAKINGIGRGYDLILFLIFSVTVALGIKLVGVLLMGALTIIPAAVAKNIGRSMAGFIIISTIAGGVIAVLGASASRTFGMPPGPAIILLGVVFFAASLPFAARTRS